MTHKASPATPPTAMPSLRTRSRSQSVGARTGSLVRFPDESAASDTSSSANGQNGRRLPASDELLAQSMVSGAHALKPRTHKHQKKVHKHSISGAKLVDWILKYGDMQSRDAAQEFGATLLECGYIAPTPLSLELLPSPQSFVEQRGVYYRFAGPLLHKVVLDPEQDRSRRISSSSSSSSGGTFSLRRRSRNKSRDLLISECPLAASSPQLSPKSPTLSPNPTRSLSPRGTSSSSSYSFSSYSSSSSSSSSSAASASSPEKTTETPASSRSKSRRSTTSFTTTTTTTTSPAAAAAAAAAAATAALSSSLPEGSWPAAKLYEAAGLTQSDLDVILANSIEVNYDCGDILMAEDAHFAPLRFIQRGRVSVLFLGDILGEAGPGLILGILPGLLSRRLPLRLEADSSTVRCKLLDPDVLPRLERDHPALMLRFLRLLGLQVAQLLSTANQLFSETVSLSGAAFSCSQLRSIQVLNVREERLALSALVSASFSGPQLSPVSLKSVGRSSHSGKRAEQGADHERGDDASGTSSSFTATMPRARESAVRRADSGEVRQVASACSLTTSNSSSSYSLSPCVSEESFPCDGESDEVAAEASALPGDGVTSSSSSSVFALEPAGWAQLLPYAEECIYAEGEYLIRCGSGGEDADAGSSPRTHTRGDTVGLFQLLEGEAMVTLPPTPAQPQEEESLLTVVSPGQTVGEISWLTGMSPMASVVASSPQVRVLFLSRDKLTQAFSDHSHTRLENGGASTSDDDEHGDQKREQTRQLEASVAGFALEAIAAKVQATLNALRRVRKSRTHQLLHSYRRRSLDGLDLFGNQRGGKRTGDLFPPHSPTAAARDAARSALDLLSSGGDVDIKDRPLGAAGAPGEAAEGEQAMASPLALSAGAVFTTVDNTAVLVRATKQTLLDMLASSSADHAFVNTFLITHSYFMTTKDLISFLQKSFLDDLHRCATNAEERSSKMKLLSVTKRLINWLGESLANTPAITAQLKEFVNHIKVGPEVLHPFTDIITDAIFTNTVESSNKSLTSGTVGFLSCSMQTNQTTVNPLSVPAELLAKSMTQVEWELFTNVTHRELLHKRFEKEASSPDLHRCTEYLNGVVQWAAETILKTKGGPRERSQVICQLINLAQEFQTLNNFSGVLQIVGALGHCAIARLSQSFALVPSKLQNALTELQNLIYPMCNYKAYRNAVANATPPLLPIQGVVLKDLTSIEELPTLSGKYVQFDKLQCIAAIVSNFRAIQRSTPYSFVVESVLRHSLKSLSSRECMSEDALYQLSRELEPPSSTTSGAGTASALKKNGTLPLPSKRKKKRIPSGIPCVQATVNEAGDPEFEVIVHFSNDPIWKTLGIHRSDLKVRMPTGNVAKLLSAFQVEISSTLSAPSQLLLRERLSAAKLVLKRNKEQSTLSMSDDFLKQCSTTPDARLVLRLSNTKVKGSSSGFENDYKLAQLTVDNERLRNKVRVLSTTVLEMQQLQRQQMVEFTNILQQMVSSSDDLKHIDLSPIAALASEAESLMEATAPLDTTPRVL